MIGSLLQQLKQRRLELGLKQSDMFLRIGVSRQQYQHLESKGNPRLDTLELLAKGLGSELLLIPAEKRDQVLALLQSNDGDMPLASSREATHSEAISIADDPWQGLLEDDI